MRERPENPVPENETLFIPKKGRLKGEDTHKTFSIRIKQQTVDQLDMLANLSDRSRNEIINMMLEFALQHYELEDTD